MKKLVATLATVVSLTAHADSHMFNELSSRTPTDLNVVLNAFGVVDYYSHNCAGLTPYGQETTMKVLHDTDLRLLEASELMNTLAFRNGYTTASRFSCNDLRDELFSVGARRLFR